MSDRIRAIRQTKWRGLGFVWTYSEREYEGFEIETDSETIRVGIDTEQSCCETWGYLCSEDDSEKFVGATLLRLDRVTRESERDPVIVREIDSWYGLDEGSAIFVNVVTDRGTFQLAAYNDHNGFYGHEAVIIGRGHRFGEVI